MWTRKSVIALLFLLSPLLLAARPCGSQPMYVLVLQGDGEMTVFRHPPGREFVFETTDGLGPLVHDDCIGRVPKGWADNQLEVCNDIGCVPRGVYDTGPRDQECRERTGTWVEEAV